LAGMPDSSRLKPVAAKTPRGASMHLRQLRKLYRVVGIVAALGLGASTAHAQPATEQIRPALAVWDTGTSSAEPLAPETIERRSGWRLIATGETAQRFEGDVVIANRSGLAVARRQGTGVELYSLGSGKPVFRARLVLVRGTRNDAIALV